MPEAACLFRIEEVAGEAAAFRAGRHARCGTAGARGGGGGSGPSGGAVGGIPQLASRVAPVMKERLRGGGAYTISKRRGSPRASSSGGGTVGEAAKRAHRRGEMEIGAHK